MPTHKRARLNLRVAHDQVVHVNESMVGTASLGSHRAPIGARRYPLSIIKRALRFLISQETAAQL